MDGTWCIAPEIQRRKSRYRYDFIRPFDLYLKFMGVELEQDLSWITPHVMRHTFGSPLAIAGESLAKISEWMGDDPRVTDRHYLHFKEGEQRSISCILLFLLSSGSSGSQSIVAFGANPFPASQALVVIKQRQPILLYFKYQPFGLPHETQVPFSAEYSLGIFDSGSAMALRYENEVLQRLSF